MPSDILHETDTFTNKPTDEPERKIIDSVKSIWLEANNPTEMYNSECAHRTLDAYLQEIQRHGFIVGTELEDVKANSRRSLMQRMSHRISNNVQSLYDKINGDGIRYVQIGVRVPTKEHVSEIVGKQGLKIKEIRDKTGAVIITPGENEDHVFIIEAAPAVALSVAKSLDERANDITTNRAKINYQRALSFNAPSLFGGTRSFTTMPTSQTILAAGDIDVPKNMVGRIIGTHGSIITTIQKDTGTEIRSPPKDKHRFTHNNNTKPATFEIIVFRHGNSIDIDEALQRIKKAKQIIAHVAMHQIEKIRDDGTIFSNYRIKNFVPSENYCNDKEKIMNYHEHSMSWMWPDIERLNERVSKAVVSRILEESKNKSKCESEHNSIQDYNPYRQRNSWPNDTNIPIHPSQKHSERSQINTPTSPNLLNGISKEEGNHFCDLTTGHQGPLIDFYNSSNNNDTDCTSNGSIQKEDTSSNESYSDYCKPGTINSSLCSIEYCNHGAIGDHIKKVPPKETAQFTKM